MKSLRRDLKGGIRIGLQYALGYTLIALLILGLGGALTASSGWNTLLHYAAAYLLAGVTGGAIYGLLRPITNRKWGLMLVLSLVGVIIYPATMYTYLSLTGKSAEPGIWALAALMGVFFGIGAGDKVWEKKKSGSEHI
jgi:peptidoglycan/LPS O-acetylase OafA/YrhL